MAIATLTSLGRQERQKSNLAGLSMLAFFGASQFKAAWPTAAMLSGQAVDNNIYDYLEEGTEVVFVRFDIGSGRGKSRKVGPIGNNSFAHELECTIAGISKEQSAALELMLNEGVVAVGIYKDGKQQIFGSSYVPLQIETESDTGAVGTDKSFISIKGIGADALPFGDVFYAPDFNHWGHGFWVDVFSPTDITIAVSETYAVGSIFLNTSNFTFYEKSAMTSTEFFNSGNQGFVLNDDVWVRMIYLSPTHYGEPAWQKTILLD